MKKIIVIYGPTWSWKTRFSIEKAKELDSEIISTDSRQIFRWMDIWTWKITKEEMQGIKHHMLDIVSPDMEYSSWEYKKEAEKIIKDLFSRWKTPILCGWTGLYIDSLIYDFDIPKVAPNWELRKLYEEKAEKYWNEEVYKDLLEIDPDYGKTLHPNNIRYVIRAIEVKKMTGKSKSEFKTEKKLKYETEFFCPYSGDREALYDKINLRVKEMFDDWLVDEVKVLLESGYKKTDFWMKTIWYTEVLDYLDWKSSLEETIDLVQRRNRNYAKKQLTWFRKYEGKDI